MKKKIKKKWGEDKLMLPYEVLPSVLPLFMYRKYIGSFSLPNYNLIR